LGIFQVEGVLIYFPGLAWKHNPPDLLPE
jgi:hypothetical protein